MFNIIETTGTILHANYYTTISAVMWHFNVSHWRAHLVVSCSEEVFCWPSTAPVVYAV